MNGIRSFQLKYHIEDFLLSMSTLLSFHKSDHFVSGGRGVRGEGISFFKCYYGFYFGME